MNVITVIADDITGAAEIAGIGYRMGLQTALMTEAEGEVPDAELLVFATDTRSMNRKEAVEETRKVIRFLKEKGIGRLFKKTDSALRGHISAELQALQEETGYSNILLLPQNPSKGRIIRDGIYYIHHTPLHETPFAYDPEFPAHSSRADQLVTDFQVTDAVCMQDVNDTVASCSASTLLAGGADLFTAFLHQLGYQEHAHKPFRLTSPRAIIVCGSTQSKSLESHAYIRRHCLPTYLLPPPAFYEGILDDTCLEELKKTYKQAQGIVLTTSGYPPQEGKPFAERLRDTVARLIGILVDQSRPHELIIEGGATAFTLLRQLGWSSFRLSDEVAPGVVRMQCTSPDDVFITLKPGSYDWGNLFE